MARQPDIELFVESFIQRTEGTLPSLENLPEVSVPLSELEFFFEGEPECEGLTESEISCLSEVGSLHTECSICMEVHESGLVLPCKHSFHTECILPWLHSSNKCPNCRNVIT
mmetsp:Transcript_5127/g.7718  ORF Transcript_5127/g.7718 Transcript_5127/m.7718 type:complete len:112 (+) Transcript_5127:12-347(+)